MSYEVGSGRCSVQVDGVVVDVPCLLEACFDFWTVDEFSRCPVVAGVVVDVAFGAGFEYPADVLDVVVMGVADDV